MRLESKSCLLVSVGAVLAAFFLPSANIHATAISVDPGPAPTITTQITASFNDLNGTALQGQTVDLNFTWAAGKFIRLFTVTDSTFAALLTFQTDCSGVAGFLQGTAYLVDKNGHEVGAPMTLGSASGNDGSLTVGMFPLLSGGRRPLDFFGMHFDLQLPSDASFSITGGGLEFVTPGTRRDDKFGVGPGVPADIVPETGFTALLLGLGLVALVGMKRYLAVAI